jgi:hypothetical protein
VRYDYALTRTAGGELLPGCLKQNECAYNEYCCLRYECVSCVLED